MVVVLFDRNMVFVFWSLYWYVVKNQRCGDSLGECKATRYQVTNYTILMYTCSVSVVREKCHGQATSKLVYYFDVASSVLQNMLSTKIQKEVLDYCSRKWKMMEICLKLMKVIRRNVISYCLKDFSLSARFLDSRSRVVARPGPRDIILCRLMYNLLTFLKTVVFSRLRETYTSGLGVIC